MFKDKRFDFDLVGVDLNAAVDRVRANYAAILVNWLMEQDGILTPRPGLGNGVEVVAGQSPVHSIRRINDASSGSTNASIIVGTGTRVATVNTDLTAPTNRDGDYSGDPLAIAIHRPGESIKPYAYIGDRTRMRKIDRSGAIKGIGLAPPTTAPSAVLSAPVSKVLDEFDDHTLWTAAGTAGAKANFTRIDGATRTVTKFLYDTGNTGWACVRPSSMTDVGAGMRLTVDTGGSTETVVVQRTLRGTGSTTIAGALYEVGFSGRCSIQFTTPFDLEIDSMIFLDATGRGGPSEYARVLSVHKGHDGNVSIQCSTSGGGGYTAGDTVQAFASFRAYFTVNHADGVAMSAAGVTFDVTSGTGTISRTVALDLSLLASGLATRSEEIMRIGLFCSTPANISEIKLQLDIDPAVNTFTRNYLQKILRPSDLTAVTVNAQTLIASQQVRVQRGAIEEAVYIRNRDIDPTGPTDVQGLPQRDIPYLGDYPEDERKAPQTNPQAQVDAGQNQWTEVGFRIGDLLREDFGKVGTDRTRGLQHVAALRITVISTGNCTVRVDAWHITGGYGPDTFDVERPITFCYAGRDAETGVMSNVGPVMRGGVYPERQKVTLTLTQHTSADVDELVVFVFGGPLLGWRFAGTCDNSATPTFDYTDTTEEMAFRESYDFEELRQRYQPWPSIQPPVSNGTCATYGTFMNIIAPAQNANLAPGTVFRINGRDYTFVRRLDTGRFEIEESAGVQAGARLEIAAPIIQAQNSPVFAGPFKGYYFAVDPLNPGILLYSNENDPDSTDETHRHEVCQPGEPLMNVLVTETQAVVWSSENAYAIVPNFTLSDRGGDLFITRKLPSPSSGLFARWAFCNVNGDAVWLAEDGIYSSGGGAPVLLSEDLRPLFPKGSAEVGTLTNVVFFPPDLTNEAALRLSYANGNLYFNYLDTNGARRTLVRRMNNPDGITGWRAETYTPGVTLHYAEEGRGIKTVLAGSSNGRLFRLGRTQADDANAAIALDVQTLSYDADDGVVRPIWGNVIAEYDTDGATLSLTPGFDNHSVTLAATSLNEAAGLRQRSIDFNSGDGQRGRNISVRITGSVTTQRPKLRLWRPSWWDRPETTLLRAEDYQVKQEGPIWARGLRIAADTFGVSRSAKLQYTKDDGTTAEITITGINHAKMTERYYEIPAGIYMVAARLLPNDANTWDFAGFKLDGDPVPPSTKAPGAWTSYKEARFVYGVRFDIDTENVSVDMTVQGDQNAVLATIAAGSNHGPVLANGRAVLGFDFDAPFITHLIREVPSANCRRFGVEWITDPEPELAHLWKTQQTAHGLHGYQFLGDGWITVRSTDSLIVRAIPDGNPAKAFFATFYDSTTNTSLARKKLRYRWPARKFKTVEYEIYALTSAGRMALYKKDCGQEIKPWGFEGRWQIVNPFGDSHYETGPRI